MNGAAVRKHHSGEQAEGQPTKSGATTVCFKMGKRATNEQGLKNKANADGAMGT